MSNYKGYLIKFGTKTVPFGYIAEYSSTPNQRLENEAQRDQNGTLHRSTIPNFKTSIKFSTHILTLDEKLSFQSIINSAVQNSVQRKVVVTYWNDEVNNYKTGTFYIPDIEFQIMRAEKDTIYYNPISVELIEY